MALDLTAILTPSEIDSGDAGYPYGKAVDVVSAGSTTTGTPYNSTTRNDVLGFLQALLDAGGVTPNGTPDSVSNAQYLEALNNIILANTPASGLVIVPYTDGSPVVHTVPAGGYSRIKVTIVGGGGGAATQGAVQAGDGAAYAVYDASDVAGGTDFTIAVGAGGAGGGIPLTGGTTVLSTPVSMSAGGGQSGLVDGQAGINPAEPSGAFTYGGLGIIRNGTVGGASIFSGGQNGASVQPQAGAGGALGGQGGDGVAHIEFWA